MSAEICEEYASTLKDLTFNSKPHITMLTMLAEENSQYAPQIVKVVEAHLQKVKPECKLPTLYLIDSIMKNVPNVYQPLFTQNIVSNFCSVFEKVDEKIRAQMYKLRQTWADIFPNKKLYAIDVRVKLLDPAWPVLAQPPQQSIHVNPRFLPQPAAPEAKPTRPAATAVPAVAAVQVQELQEEEMRKQLLAKQQELFKLQRQKLELELLTTQVLVEEQKRQLIIKEQQLRVQQNLPGDLQNKLTLQQLTTAALAVANSSVDRSNRKGVTTSAPIGGATVDNKRPDVVSVGAVDPTKPVISPLVANNKTIDVNTHAKPGLANNVFPSKNEFVPSSVQQPKSSQEKSAAGGGFSSSGGGGASTSPKSTVASVAQTAGKSSLAALLVRPAPLATVTVGGSGGGGGGSDPRLLGRIGREAGRSVVGAGVGSTPPKTNHKAHAPQKTVSKQSPTKKNFAKPPDSSPKSSGKDGVGDSKKRNQSPKKGKGKTEGGSVGSSGKVVVGGVDKKSSKGGGRGGGGSGGGSSGGGGEMTAAKREGKGSSAESPSKLSQFKDKGRRGPRRPSPVRGEGLQQQQHGGRNKGMRMFSPSGVLLREGLQHRSSHSRSRSPGHLEKSRGERSPGSASAASNKRSPRKEKENDRKAATDGGGQQSQSLLFKDVDLRTASTSGAPSASGEGKSAHKHGLEPGTSSAGDERGGAGAKQSDDEPPLKKSKGSDDSELDEIFGGKDQDYRQLMRPVPKLSPIGNENQGWAQYKASRPDEFKHAPLRPRDNVGDPFGFGRHDLDLRQGGMPNTPSTPSPSGPPTPRIGSGPFSPGASRDVRDPRTVRDRSYSGSSPAAGARFTPTGRSDPRSRGAHYQATRESDPSIPSALAFDKGAEIMRQADLQLRSGQLTMDQHREIMEQLAKLFELQRLRHVQREQRGSASEVAVQRDGSGGSGRSGGGQNNRFRPYPEEEQDTIMISSESLSDSDNDMDVDDRRQIRRSAKKRKLTTAANKTPPGVSSSPAQASFPTPLRDKFLKPSELDDREPSPTGQTNEEPATGKSQTVESDMDARGTLDRDERREESSRQKPTPSRNDADDEESSVIEASKNDDASDMDLRVADKNFRQVDAASAVSQVSSAQVPSDDVDKFTAPVDSPLMADSVIKERPAVRAQPANRHSSKQSAGIRQGAAPLTSNTVNIDDKPREVLFFGEHSIVLLGPNDDDPRLIAFRGPPQDVTFDGDDGDKCVVRLGFGPRDFKEFELSGHRHTLRFGAPTRELLIDGQPYSAIFGGPPIVATFQGVVYRVRLCGPTPEVYFGDESRHDLLARIREAGKPTDDRVSALQRSPQKDESSGNASPVRWVTSTIGRDYDPREWKQDLSEANREEEHNRFGGSRPPFGRSSEWRNNRFPPEEMPFRGPERGRGFRGNDRRGAGRGSNIHHRDFEPWAGRGRGGGGSSMDDSMRTDDYHQTGMDQRNLPGRLHHHHQIRGEHEGGRRHSPIMDEFYDRDHSPYGDVPTSEGRTPNYYADPRFAHGGGGPAPLRGTAGMNVPPRNRFDGPNSRMRGGGGSGSGPMAPRGMGHHPPLPQGMRFTGPPPPYGFPVGGPPNPNFPPPPIHQQDYGYPSGPPPMMPGMNPPGFPHCPPISIPPQIDVNFLFEKLVATGIVAAPKASNPEKPEEQNSNDGPSEEGAAPKSAPAPDVVIPNIPFTNEGLRAKYPGVVASLYFGIQCSSCGVRFTSEQTDKYAQHLDWHFRQNRREKDSVRKALSRKWHYVTPDWVQFEEIEDLEERARSFFELQANEEQGEGEDVSYSVAAGENEDDKNCVVCHELFELYWDEEQEEWHFRDCARHDEKNYHPLCYEDYKEQMIKAAVEEEKARLQAESDRLAAIKKEEEEAAAAEAAAALKKEEPEEEPESVAAVPMEEETAVVAAAEDDPLAETPVDGAAVKVEPAEALLDTEPMNAEEQLEPMDVQEMSVFNVLASSYSMPPLIGFEEELEGEGAESTLDTKDDAVAAIKTEPDFDIKKEQDDETTMATDAEPNPESVTNQETTSTDDAVSGEQRGSERRSLVAVQQDENDLCAATNAITIKQEPIESDENDILSAVDDCVEVFTLVERLVSAVCGDGDAATAYAGVDEAVAQECLNDPLHGEIVEKITWGTTDVLLAEPPSSCSGGETSDGGGGHPTEDAEEESDGGEPRIVDGFTVLPPVQIGTEMSGLCTIL